MESGPLNASAGSPDAASAAPPAASANPSAREAGRQRSRWLRWTVVFLAAILLPKCLACVAGYLALATGLMVAVPELCGEGSGTTWPPWLTLAVMALPLTVAGLWFVLKNRRKVSGRHDPAR